MSSRTPPARPGPEPVAHAVRAYAATQPSLVPVTAAFATLVTELLDDAGINYLSVTSRTKTVASFAGKAMRTGPDGADLYTDPLHEITDTIGVRVITYVHSDVAAVADVLAEELTILADRDLGEETAREGGFGYASRHMLVEPDPARPLPAAYDVATGHQASLQVRTVLQHAWAEFEHDIRYKGSIPEADAPDLDRRFTLAAGLLELADREFSSIRARLEGSPGHRTTDDSGDPRIVAQELATFLSGTYPDAGWSRTDHYGWIAGLLLELGITSLEELGALLASVDSTAIHDRMGYKYPTGGVRRLDDALLAIFGERYAALTGNAHRVELLRTRLGKLSS
ncbi:GTP pyrophosphokinase [Nocardioides cavernaquae]|uniref:GTP pyrophosphokinase n=1 Tax=Nocardioides cavernaquae TaxID=2321396 RepID=A0A3A5H9F1_9ACTN|nr:GTP pyrophosphokinase [Nocardioides cavernaquae]RJS46478.1 GTP pyrophosphokinase [Nocardioides cavernaquae]